MRHSLGNTRKKYDSIQDSPYSVESVPPPPNTKQNSDNFAATFGFRQPPNHWSTGAAPVSLLVKYVKVPGPVPSITYSEIKAVEVLQYDYS